MESDILDGSQENPDSVVVTDEELESFIAEINGACPSLDIRLDEVSLWNAGLVPFGQNAPGSKDLRYGHRSRLIDHANTDGIQNLITLIGVRFTTADWKLNALSTWSSTSLKAILEFAGRTSRLFSAELRSNSTLMFGAPSVNSEAICLKR